MNKENILKIVMPRIGLFQTWLEEDKKRKVYLGVASLLLFIYFLSLGEEKMSYVYKSDEAREFSSEKILDNPYKTIYDGKLSVLEETRNSILTDNRALREEIEGLKIDLKELIQNQHKKDSSSVVKKDKEPMTTNTTKPIELSASPISGDGEGSSQSTVNKPKKKRKKRVRLSKSKLVFPVKMKVKPVESGVVIGVGSWAKGTIIAGAEIPQSKTYPVLIQLDQAYTMANKKNISLVGCLMVAKATPQMSTRNIELQPQSMGCFSKSGKYFEKKGINGWGTDSLDSNFGIKAEFKSNVNRLAEFSFAKSMLEGVQEIISRKSKNIGGADPDRADLVVGESAASTSTMIADFLMKQAKALLPTLGVNSGREVYIVMKDSVRMPYEFFDQGGLEDEEFDYSFNLFQ